MSAFSAKATISDHESKSSEGRIDDHLFPAPDERLTHIVSYGYVCEILTLPA